MSIVHRRDPGECPVCGQAHSTCTGGDKNTAIVVRQLPARDRSHGSPTVVAARRLGPTEFSTKTYDRAKHGPPKKGQRPRR